jgi:hypothetical protein
MRVEKDLFEGDIIRIYESYRLIFFMSFNTSIL